MQACREYLYRNVITDDFSGISRSKADITSDYKYINKNPLWNLLAFIIYRLICTPAGYIYLKAKFHCRFVNRSILKPFREKGYFLYGNHTNIPADGFLPSMITFPKKNYVIVSSENISLKGTENIMMMLGALPLPSGFRGMRSFLNAIEKRAVNHHVIAIYPEAHIWPYSTRIRPYKSDSFRYPAMFEDPCFCFTVTYQKRKHSSKANMTVYVDGPFYPDMRLSAREQKDDLHDRILKAMTDRSKASTYEFYHYEKSDSAKEEAR